jgi:signal transduction histidine kinase/DNA-binding response OmpR family regulator
VDGCYVTEAIRHGFVSSAEEDIYVRADGSTFPVEITSSPLVDDDRVSGAVVVFRDVTQRQEVDRMKNEFLSVVSHELRTPLTSIRGSLGLVASGSLVELTPQAERMVSIAVESSERLTRLINDILDIERIQSGKLPMNLTPHAAGHLLEATATEMSGLAAMADVRLEVSSEPGRVLADADRMVQALTNLVGNAVKFSPAGAVVRLQAVADESHMTFCVHDDGRGIPEDKLESVFEPFEQVDSTDARQKGGTGLGLSICRGIVERHGGRIWAESDPDTGTTVRFTLPKVRSLDEADQAPPLDAPVVLVCDEDADTVTSLSAMLSRHGFRPVGVSDGSDVLRRAAASRPAAVLLGSALHGRSRADILGRLRDLDATRTIPVIAICNPADADPAVGAVTDGWLVKPVTEERLVATVTMVLEGRRSGAGVLIVEDDEDLAGVLRVLLSSRGLEVVHVASVAEAVAHAMVMRPQVVVLDLGLPDGDGSEVVARLREAGALEGTAVVVYSADDVLDEHADGLDDSTVFLTKARVTPEELEDRVLRLIDAMTGTTMGGDLESASSIGG